MRSEPFADDELSADGFLDGRLVIRQPIGGYRAAMDPVLLAAAVPAMPGESVLELGCGVGVASLCLGRRVERLALSGIEIQPAYADLARRNAEENRTGFEVFVGDLAQTPPELSGKSFDHVIANPPYFRKGGGTAAGDPGRERAQREALPLGEWVRTGLKRLRPGGWLTMIQSADRLPELCAAAMGGSGSMVVLPIAGRAGRSAARIIMSARKGGRGAFRLLPPFIVHEGRTHLADRDDQTLAARAVLRDGGALDLGGQ
ncbi:MAG: methyltransferase [Paracoccaceae bacterium]